jgi:DNA repair protein RadC
MQKGVQYLSDAELLAIFLRVGVTGKTAVDLARDLLTQFGSLSNILMLASKKLMRYMAWAIVNIVSYKRFLR